MQRGLNNCFAYDLVPSAVVEAAIRAERRVNDYATAVRVFESVKDKVQNKYVDEWKPLRAELGIIQCFTIFQKSPFTNSLRRAIIEGRNVFIVKTLSSN